MIAADQCDGRTTCHSGRRRADWPWVAFVNGKILRYKQERLDIVNAETVGKTEPHTDFWKSDKFSVGETPPNKCGFWETADHEESFRRIPLRRWNDIARSKAIDTAGLCLSHHDAGRHRRHPISRHFQISKLFKVVHQPRTHPQGLAHHGTEQNRTTLWNKWIVRDSKANRLTPKPPLPIQPPIEAPPKTLFHWSFSLFPLKTRTNLHFCLLPFRIA